MSPSEASNTPAQEQAEAPQPDLHLWKLPRGRHGLPRELVTQSQRERLLAAVIRVTAAKGYQATSVADILEEAGVGRESFYRQFKDKEDCFVTANDALVDDLEARVGQAYGEPGTWPERVRNGLAETLGWFASNPDIARVMMIEMGTVGPIASERFRTTFRRFTALLDDGKEFIDSAPDLPNLASTPQSRESDGQSLIISKCGRTGPKKKESQLGPGAPYPYRNSTRRPRCSETPRIHLGWGVDSRPRSGSQAIRVKRSRSTGYRLRFRCK